MGLNFDLIEITAFHELYKIQYNSEEWFYTSSESSITYAGNTYSPAYIKRGNLEKKSDLQRHEIEITFSPNTLFLRYIGNSPVNEAILTIYQFQDESNVITAFKGVLAKVTFGQDRLCIAKFDEITAIQTKLPRFLISPSCNHILFDAGCGINKETKKVSLTISGKDDENNIVESVGIGAYPADYFIQGVAEFEGELRTIWQQTGGSFVIHAPFSGLEIGDIIYAYPGCNRSAQMCKNKFNNLEKFLGMPYVPRKNPIYYGI